MIDANVDRRSERLSRIGVEAKGAYGHEAESVDTLAELYQLLNNYAPQWYTERHYERTTSVLRNLGRL